MIKALVTVLSLTLTLATGSQAFALLFGDSELIRVAYSPTGTVEWATDLGNVNTLATYHNRNVGGGGDAIKVNQILGTSGFSEINVAYFSLHNDPFTMANREAWATFITGLTSSPVSSPKWFQNFGTAAGNVSLAYTGNGFPVIGTASIANNLEALAGYFASMDQLDAANTGRFGGLTTAAKNPGGEMNLVSLSLGGSVEQDLYAFTGASLNGTRAGAQVMTLRTNADGSTTINPSSIPEPTTFMLMGAGLLGLLLLKRGNSSRPENS